MNLKLTILVRDAKMTSVRSRPQPWRAVRKLIALGSVLAALACSSGGGGDDHARPPVAPDPGLPMIRISPEEIQLEPGGSLQLSAHRHTEQGVGDDVTATATWTSSNELIGAFATSSPGVLTGRAPGAIQITASIGGLSGTSSVIVRAPSADARRPLRVSSSNPRYFEGDDGVPLILGGSHTWTNLQDNGVTANPAPFDYDDFLRLLVDNGHNFFRLWAWEQARWNVSSTADQNWVAPSVYERTGPGAALDGLPRFDLSRFNQDYFDRLRARVQEAGERGLYVSVMLFNGFSVTKAKPSSPPGNRNPWRGHPFNAANNINGVNGDPNGDDSGEETHELAVPAVTALQEAYVRKVIDTVNDLDNVLYEISNESHGDSHSWQYHLIDLIHAYESTKPKQHPVGMTVAYPNGGNGALFASNAEWVSPSGDIDNRPIASGAKVILADTDHLCGVCGDGGWPWRSFLAGENPVLMDPYDRTSVVGGLPGLPVNTPELIAARRSIGQVIRMSQRMNLRWAVPRPELASSGHCLADLTSSVPTLAAYAPTADSITVDLRELSAGIQLHVEWLRVDTGVSTDAGLTSGGATRVFRPPFSGPAVLFLTGTP